MANYIGVKELRQNLEKYSAQVRRGKSFIVLKRNKPQFRMCPVDSEGAWEQVVDFTSLAKEGVLFEKILNRF